MATAHTMVEGKAAGRLLKPVWFDTGLRMSDGTPRTIAAYDHEQLRRYSGDALWSRVKEDALQPGLPVEEVVTSAGQRGRPRKND